MLESVGESISVALAELSILLLFVFSLLLAEVGDLVSELVDVLEVGGCVHHLLIRLVVRVNIEVYGSSSWIVLQRNWNGHLIKVPMFSMDRYL